MANLIIITLESLFFYTLRCIIIWYSIFIDLTNLYSTLVRLIKGEDYYDPSPFGPTNLMDLFLELCHHQIQKQKIYLSRSKFMTRIIDIGPTNLYPHKRLSHHWAKKQQTTTYILINETPQVGFRRIKHTYADLITIS